MFAFTETINLKTFTIFLAIPILSIFLWTLAPSVVMVALIIGVIVLFAYRLKLGLYVLAAVSFFSGWEVVLIKYPWIKSVPYISHLNAPVVDFVAAALLISCAIAWLISGTRLRAMFVHSVSAEFKWGIAFLISAFVSVFFAYDRQQTASLWYFARSMVFVLVAYLAFPYYAIHKHATVSKILSVWFGVGTLVAIYGLSSIFTGGAVDWVRAHPYTIFGFNPLGFNHNQLAEVLVAIIPIGIYFFITNYLKNDNIRNIVYGLGAALMILAALFTLSRAAWLSLGVELVLINIFWGKQIYAFLKKHKEIFVGILIILVLAIGYMSIFLRSSVVSSSNASRFDAIKIVSYYINKSPVFGYGPGMFVRILGDTKVFTIEYGDPLESHGFLQKILFEDGFAGLLLFVIFLIAIFSKLWQAQKVSHGGQKMAQFLLIMAVGAVFYQLFNTEYFSAVMWLPIGVALANARIATESIL